MTSAPDLNLGPLFVTATALPTLPQPLPNPIESLSLKVLEVMASTIIVYLHCADDDILSERRQEGWKKKSCLHILKLTISLERSLACCIFCEEQRLVKKEGIDCAMKDLFPYYGLKHCSQQPQHSGSVCANNTAALGSNPKHDVSAF